MKIDKLLAGTLALVLVAGLGSPSYAQLCPLIPGCTTDKLYLSVEDDSSVKQFSSTGGAPLNGDFATGLVTPECIAFDSAGNFYVADEEGLAVLQYSSGGGAPIDPDFAPAVDRPACIAFDSAGNLYVSDLDLATVLKFSSTGNLLNANFATGLTTPDHIGFDAAGNLYVIDDFDGTLSQYSSTGGAPLNGDFATGLVQPSAFAFDSAGNLYVSSEGDATVKQYSSTGGAPLNGDFATGLASPGCLAFDSAGNLYVVDGDNTGKVKQYSGSGGTSINPDFTPEFVEAGCLAFDFTIQVVGGELLPIESTSLILAGAQSTSWMILLFVGWSGFIIYCLVRFRQRPGHAAVHQPIEARWNRWLEIGVAVAETVVLVGFAMPVWAKFKTITPEVPSNPVIIRVVAEQFKWLFHYPLKVGMRSSACPPMQKTAE